MKTILRSLQALISEARKHPRVAVLVLTVLVAGLAIYAAMAVVKADATTAPHFFYVAYTALALIAYAILTFRDGPR